MVSNGLHFTLGYVVPPLLGFLVLLCLALISLLRGGRKPVNLLFAVICLMGALHNADVAIVSILPDERLALRVDRIIHFFFVFSIPVYIRFVHTFLGIRGRQWLEIAALLLSTAFVAIVPTDLYFSGLHNYPFGRIARAGALFPLVSAAIAFTVCYCLLLLYTALKRTVDNQRRNRIKYILGGLGGSALLMAFTILPVSGIAIYPLGNFSFIPAVFLAVGVLKYDLLDIGALIRRGTFYILLTGVLTTLYVLVILLFHTLFLSVGGGDPLTLSVVLALLIVLLFNPLKDWVQRIIDRLFFRGRYDYRLLLKEISGKLAGLLKLDQIRGLLIGAIKEALQVERVILVLKVGEDCCLYDGTQEKKEGEPLPAGVAALIGSLEGQPLSRAALENHPNDQKQTDGPLQIFNLLKVTLLIPLRSPAGTAGLIALGQKRSGELFVDEDLELLSTIANQAATAIENARSYEALEALNQELEQKVNRRTAALRDALAQKERTQAQLIQSESLAAIGQLVAGTAHELNNPIAAAMSLVESSIETIGDPVTPAQDREQLLDDLRFSLAELRRAGMIIRSLLDLSRQTQTYLEPVDMNRVLDDALRILHNQYKKWPVEIEKDYDPALPALEGNFANLGQVMINIIRNALQALPEGKGRIWLASRYLEAEENIVVTCRDNGTGIPDAAIKDIFKPFFTTKPVGRGTGLGLYISHEIVRRHGGQILVESEAGSGTTITVQIPCRRREV
jgi:signal transduction histidine kinase